MSTKKGSGPSPFMDGFLRQSDGEVAGIAAIYTKSSTEDVALIKVGDGINVKCPGFCS